MTDETIRFDDGASYELMMGRWSRLVGERFLDWVDVPDGGRWVDVGCGNGAFTELVVGRCRPSAVRAFDPSPGRIGSGVTITRHGAWFRVASFGLRVRGSRSDVRDAPSNPKPGTRNSKPLIQSPDRSKGRSAGRTAYIHREP